MAVTDVFAKNIELRKGIYNYPITNKTTREVTGLYDIEQFPNYTNSDNKLSIVEKGNINPFAYELKNLSATKNLFSKLVQGPVNYQIIWQ
jgi:hypothetical protein